MNKMAHFSFWLIYMHGFLTFTVWNYEAYFLLFTSINGSCDPVSILQKFAHSKCHFIMFIRFEIFAKKNIHNLPESSGAINYVNHLLL